MAACNNKGIPLLNGAACFCHFPYSGDRCDSFGLAVFAITMGVLASIALTILLKTYFGKDVRELTMYEEDIAELCGQPSEEPSEMTTAITQNGWSNQKKQLQHDQRAMHQSVRDEVEKGK